MTNPNKIREETDQKMRHNYKVAYIILFFVIIAEASIPAFADVNQHNKKLLNVAVFVLATLTILLTRWFIVPYFNQKVSKKYYEILNPKQERRKTE